LRCRRRLNVIGDRKPEQLSAFKNFLFDVSEFAKPGSLDRSAYQVFRQRPRFCNVGRADA
jgi:hypothetical protein